MTFEKEIIGGHELYCGNTIDILPNLEKVDVVITDPPYSSGGFQEGGKTAGSIGTFNSQGETPKIAMDNLSTRGYYRLIRRVADLPWLKEIYIFCDWKMWAYTCDAIEDSFFRVRNMLVWNKITPGLGVGWRMQHELICHGIRKINKPTTHKGNVLTVARGEKSDHPTQKPISLMETIVTMSQGKRILDPFMGSGTTGVACIRQGRKFVGIEKEKRFFDTACERLQAELDQPDMFSENKPQQENIFN